MSEPISPLSRAETWDYVSESYASEIVPVFEAASRAALAHTRVCEGERVVDIASGPGTLSFLAARLGAQVEALDFSPEMIARLQARKAREQETRITAQVGDGMSLPYPDDSFDAGFSMFGLMFFPDRARGFSELRRVLHPGGRAVISSWAPMSDVPIMALFFQTLGDLLPGPKTPPKPLPLSVAEEARAEMEAAGFREVVSLPVRVSARFETTAEMVRSFARSNAMLAPLKDKMGAGWESFLQEFTARIRAARGEGAQEYEMLAHLTCGLR
jgi:SAM-dependent methyltransferase